MPLLGYPGGKRDGLNYTCQEKNELCQGLQVACMMHLTCWALPYCCSPWSNKQQLPRRRGEEQVTQLSPKEVSIWNPSILLLANPYWIDWHEGCTVFLSPLLIQRLTDAAGPLCEFLLYNPSSGLRGMADCWGWAFAFPSFPPSPHFLFKSGIAKLLANSQSVSARVSLSMLPG